MGIEGEFEANRMQSQNHTKGEESTLTIDSETLFLCAVNKTILVNGANIAIGLFLNNMVAKVGGSLFIFCSEWKDSDLSS